MSGVAICRTLLSANTALLAVVPANKIMAGVIPLNTVLPAISVASISGVSHNNVAMDNAPKMVTERVQVTVMSKTYPQQKQLLALVKAAIPNTYAIVSGFQCYSIVDDIEGPDIQDVDLIIYFQSADFNVRFVR
jgi:hypothetical protein